MRVSNMPIRILIIKKHMSIGGLESHIIRVFREIDRQKIIFDFLLDSENCYHQNEIEFLGGRIYCACEKNGITHKELLEKILKENLYKVIIKFTDNLENRKDLLLTKKYGNAMRIIRLVDFEKERFWSKLYNFFVFMTSSLIIMDESYCGFCIKLFMKKKIMIVKNGLQISKYHFNMEIRNRLRKELKVDNSFVIGNVGRFYKEKNHDFLLKIFGQFNKKHPKSKLIIVGDGELREKMQKDILQYRIEKDVILLGMRDDIAHVLMAMDVFCLPSLQENTTNSILEAQATGLCCLASDSISVHANITGDVHYLSLKEPKKWMNLLEKQYNLNDQKNRGFASDKMKDAGFDIKDVSTSLMQYILEKVDK